ncbi:MAG TPA: methyltransferase domain-containing protein [Roseiflexaceae bacterium]|nr:methyltransferase domain-containing protein [Roseiflexaceae bacterium]
MDWSSFSDETKRQAAVFDRIGAEYETAFGGNPKQIAAVAWLIKRLPYDAHVLDVGCGTGIPTARMLSEAGFSVLGIDISREMIRIAREQVPHAEFALMDMADIPFQGPSFNAVTAFFSLLMLRRGDIERTLWHLTELLLPGGFLLVSMVNGDLDYDQIAFLDIPVYVSAYQRDEFAQLLVNSGLRILEIQSVEYSGEDGSPPEVQHFYYCQREY